MLLMKQAMVTGYPKYPQEALLKVSSRSNMGKLVKTTPSKSLPGVLEDMEVPDGTGVGAGGSSIPRGTFPESLMMIQALDLSF